MRQVIDGKLYDTDKAELIHEWESMADSGNFHYEEESLYRTAKGAYFITGSGGAMSSYAKSLGSGSWGGGSGIRILSESEAIEWLEDHEGTDAILEHFAAEIEEA